MVTSGATRVLLPVLKSKGSPKCAVHTLLNRRCVRALCKAKWSLILRLCVNNFIMHAKCHFN